METGDLLPPPPKKNGAGNQAGDGLLPPPPKKKPLEQGQNGSATQSEEIDISGKSPLSQSNTGISGIQGLPTIEQITRKAETPTERYAREGEDYYKQLKKDATGEESSWATAAGTPVQIESADFFKKKQKELAEVEVARQKQFAQQAVTKSKIDKVKGLDDAIPADWDKTVPDNLEVELNYIESQSPTKAAVLRDKIKQGKLDFLEESKLRASGMAKRIQVMGQEAEQLYNEKKTTFGAIEELNKSIEQYEALPAMDDATYMQYTQAIEARDQAIMEVKPVIEKVEEQKGLMKEYSEGDETWDARISDELDKKRRREIDEAYQSKSWAGQAWYNTVGTLRGASANLWGGLMSLPRTLAPFVTNPIKQVGTKYDWTDKLAEEAARMNESAIQMEPSKLQREAFENVAKVGEYEVSLRNGKVSGVYNKEGFAVEPDKAKEVVAQYEETKPATSLKVNYGAGAYQSFKAAADMGMTLLPVAGITGKVARGVGFAEGVSDFAGLYAGSMVLTNREAYDTAIEQGLSPQLASLYANGVATIEAVSESINPLESRLARRLVGRPAMQIGAREFANRYVSGVTRKTALKNGLKTVLKNSVGEGGEEVASQLMNNAQKTTFNNLAATNFETEEELSDYLNNFTLGAATGMLFTPLTIRNRSQLEKEAMSLIIENTPEALKGIDELVGKKVRMANGEYAEFDQAQAEKLKTEIETLSARVNSIKDISNFDNNKKIVATELVRQKMGLEAFLKDNENIDDIAEKKYKDGIKKINEQLEMLSGWKPGDSYIEVDGNVMDEKTFKKQINDEAFLQSLETGGHDVLIENNPKIAEEFQSTLAKYKEAKEEKKGEEKSKQEEVKPTVDLDVRGTAEEIKPDTTEENKEEPEKKEEVKIEPEQPAPVLFVDEETKTEEKETPVEEVFKQPKEINNAEAVKLSNELKDVAGKYDEGISDAKFLQENTTIENVPVDKIVPTQDKLFTGAQAEGEPILLKVGDKYYVEDGHHRIAQAIKKGDTTISSKVFSGKATNEATISPEQQGIIDTVKKQYGADIEFTADGFEVKNAASELDKEFITEEVNNILTSKSKENETISTNTGTEGKSDSEISQGDSAKKGKIRRRGTPKIRRQIRDPRYKQALASELDDPYHVVLKHFIGGGMISRSAIQELFGSKSKTTAQNEKELIGEYRARFALFGKNAPTIKELAHSLWEGQPDYYSEKYTDQDYREAIEDVLLTHTGRLSMVNEINEKERDKQEELERRYLPEDEPEVREEADDMYSHLTPEQIQELVEEEQSEEYLDALVDHYTDPEDKTPERIRAAKEYSEKLKEIDNRLFEARRTKQRKLDKLSTNVDLFAGEAKTNELFGEGQDLSTENIEKQLKPETEEVEKIQKEKSDFISNRENFIKKYDNQTNIIDAANEIAEKLRQAKFHKPDQLSAATPVSLAVDLALETAAIFIEKGGKVAQALANGLKQLRESEAYQKASQKIKDLMEKTFKEKFDALEPAGERKKKTLVTRRAYEGEFREGVKKELEKIGLSRNIDNLTVAEQKANEFIAKVGEEAALDAIRSGDVQGAMAAYIFHQIAENIDKKIGLEQNPEEAQRLEKLLADLHEEWGNRQWKSGAFNAAMGKILQTSDLGYNLQAKINEYKAQNEGEIPAEVEAKFRQIDAQLKEVRRKLAEAEERAKKAQDELTIKNIKEANERKKKEKKIEEKTSKKIRQATERLVAKVKQGKIHRPDVFSAASPASIVWDGALDIVATTIQASGNVAEAVAKGLEFIKESDWYKGLEPGKQTEVETAYQDYFAEEKTKERTDSLHDLIRELVEGGIDNIEDLTKAVMERLGIEDTEENHRATRDEITNYGKTVNLNQDEIATEIRRMKTIGRLISALEDVAKKKRPLRSGIQRDRMDAQQRALQKELREAMKGLPLDAETEAAQLKTATDAAKQRLRNQIEDLQREIDKGEKVPKNARTVQNDQEMKDLKEKRDKLKAEHDQIFKDEEYQEAKRLEGTKKRTEQRIAELERRIKEGDFSKTKKAPLIPDDELTRLRAEKVRLQEEYDKEFYKNKLKNRKAHEKVKDFLWDMWGLTRLLSATGEFSFVGIQGLINSIAHPTHAVEAFKTALSFFGSEKRTDDWLRKLKAQPWYPELKESKLSITEPHAEMSARDELFYSDSANMIWNLIGMPIKMLKGDAAFNKWKDLSPFKAFERAAVGYLDTMRVMRFLDGKEMLREQGITFAENPQAFKDMADTINTFTGRASIGENPPEWLTKVFFSPRNWASVIKTATPYAIYHFGLVPFTEQKRAGAKGFKPSVAQKIALADFSKFVGLTTTMVALAALYFNGDDDDETGVEFDPTSSDFGKIKLGDTRVDPWGGRIQQIILISRIMADSIKKEGGEKVPLGTPFRTPTREGLLIELATNKLAPSASLIEKYFSSRQTEDGNRIDKYGKPYEFSAELQDRIYPIYWGTVADLLRDDKTALDGLLMFYAYFGGGVNVYDDKSKTGMIKTELEKGEKLKGAAKEKQDIVVDFLVKNKAYMDSLSDEEAQEVLRHVKATAGEYQEVKKTGLDVKPDFSKYIEKRKKNKAEEEKLKLTEEEKKFKAKDNDLKVQMLTQQLKGKPIDQVRKELKALYDKKLISDEVYGEVISKARK